AGRVVVFAYPRTGEPGKIAIVDNWDMIPGARGCTPQTCAFRDLHKVLIEAGAARVFGLSTQDTAYQRAAVDRLHLPFPLLSDEKLALTKALRLPTMEVAGLTLIKRLAMIIDDGGAARHLKRGKRLPDIALPTTGGREVSLARLEGRTIVYCYPWTGRPG